MEPMSELTIPENTTVHINGYPTLTCQTTTIRAAQSTIEQLATYLGLPSSAILTTD